MKKIVLMIILLVSVMLMSGCTDTNEKKSICDANNEINEIKIEEIKINEIKIEEIKIEEIKIEEKYF